MIYLGIDPGPVTCCCVLYDGEQVQEVVDLPTRQLAFWIADQQRCGPAEVACEYVTSYGMAVGAEVFQTVAQIGILVALIPDIRLIPRADVKLHLCHTARAKDANVRQALIDAIGPVGTKKAPGPCYGVSKHAWAALGVAVTAAENALTEREATWHKQAEAAK
jgi:hypothetical protein